MKSFLVFVLLLLSGADALTASKSLPKLKATSLVNIRKENENIAKISSTNVRGIACVLGGSIVHLTLGTLYCWGNFLSYSPKHLRFFDGLSHPGAQPDALYVMPFSIIAQAIAMPFGPLLSKSIGASNTMLVGSLIVSFAVYMASYQKTLAHFIIFYSFMFGTGCGLAYTAPMGAGWKWMPNNKGLVSGGILAGFGLGGFIFSLIGTKYVNPNSSDAINGVFPEEVYAKFPSMLRKLAFIYAIVGIFGSMLISEPPPVSRPIEPSVSAIEPSVARINNNNETNSTVHIVDDVIKSDSIIATGLSLREALATHQFWILWLMVITSSTASLNTASIYKQFAASSSILDGDKYQAMVGGIAALFNGVGRLLWGTILDRVGFKPAFTVLTILQAILMLTYNLSAASKIGFAANTWLLYFTLAGNFALFPPAVQRIFGTKSGSMIYGVLYSAFAIASVVGGIVTKLLVKSVGWQRVFQLLATMSLLATAQVLWLKPVLTYADSVL